jgi:hypothetical protein
MVILPALFEGGLRGARLLGALLPLVVLIVGLWRRSEGWLLGLFPAAILVPIALSPQLASMFVYGPARFALVAAGATAYLFGVAFFTTFHEPPTPASVRSLSSAANGTPQRWKRRERIYWALAISAVACPATMLWWVLFDSKVQIYLAQMYPSEGKVGLMMTGLAVAIVAFWLLLYHYVWLGVLRPHRTGDRDLIATLALLKDRKLSSKPRPLFYVGVAMAMICMVLLLLRQS